MIAPQAATMIPFGTLTLNNNNNNLHFAHGQQYNTFSHQTRQPNLPANINANTFSRSYSALNSNDVAANRQQQQQQQSSLNFKLLNEDASEIFSLVINGGPKWGFRIKQLNDNRVIVSRIDKGPAEKCGLKVNDEILSVNNVPLGDGPRSLLLNDYPSDQVAAASGSPNSQNESQPVQTANEAKVGEAANKSESSPMDLASKQSIEGQPQSFMATVMHHQLELSKLDFAYQLIKHSSASNKLMLTVRRYLNPAYARASVAAANLMSQSQQQQHQVCAANESYQQAQYQQQQDYLSNQENYNQPPTSKRPHTAMGVYHAYKCCECYCQREGSERSADEEDERRLIAHLQQKQQQEQLELQQVALRQQQQQQQEQLHQSDHHQQQRQQVTCPRHAHLAGDGVVMGQPEQEPQAMDDDDDEDGEEDEEAPPEVPVRRSSRTASVGAAGSRHRSQPIPASHQRPPLPRPPPPPRDPHLDHHSHGRGQANQRRQSGSNQRGQTNLQRPRQPPPPPPPPRVSPSPPSQAAIAPPLPPTRAELERDEPMDGLSDNVLVTPPSRSAAGSRLSRAPKNIWSPSTSSTSAASSSSYDESLNLRYPLPPPLMVTTSGKTPDNQQSEVALPEHQATGGSAESGLSSNVPIGSSPSPPNTIVEMRSSMGSMDLAPPVPGESFVEIGDLEAKASDASEAVKKRKEEVNLTLASDASNNSEVSAANEKPETPTPNTNNNNNNINNRQAGGDGNSAAPNLRSFSVSLASGSRAASGSLVASSGSASLQRQAREAAAAASSRLASGGGGGSASMDRRHITQQQQQQRSYSIATATIPLKLEQQFNSKQQFASLGEQQVVAAGVKLQPLSPSANEQRAYWTLPSGGAASVERHAGELGEQQAASCLVLGDAAAAANHDDDGELAKRRDSQSQQQQQQQQVEQQYSRVVRVAKRQPLQLESADLALDEQQQQQRQQQQHRETYGNPSANLNPRQMATQAPASSNGNHNQNQNQTSSQRDERFKQMYRQMHRPTPERSLMQAVNSQQPDSSQQIKITLKSPRADHRSSPSYFSHEDLKSSRRQTGELSPTFTPGSICDYLPGQSSITQQQQIRDRNLRLYYKLIEHIDRVFSSVLPEVTSRSTHTLHAAHQPPGDHLSHQHQPPRRPSSRHRSRRQAHTHYQHQTLVKRQHQSRSGPQTPVTTITRHNQTHGHHQDQNSSEHDKHCVFTKLVKDENVNLGHELAQDADDLEEFEAHQQRDPHRQYVAVQQGRDIPLKGLRKPAPQPNVYKVGPPPPAFKLDTSSKTQDGRWIRTPEQQYRDHNLRLAHSLGRDLSSHSYNGKMIVPRDDYGQPLRRNTSSSSGLHTTTGGGGGGEADDVYRDFDFIYDTMCRQKPRIGGSQSPARSPNVSGFLYQSPYANGLAKPAALETELLAKSLGDVEEALRRATCSPVPAVDEELLSQVSSQVSPIGESTYGKLISSPQQQQNESIYGDNLTIPTNLNGNLNHSMRLSSPVVSQATTRADSCNTNQSFPTGPALVEEMTLSDLEDEICSSIMAVRESRSAQMMQQPRTREPLPLVLSRFTRTAGNSNHYGHIRAPGNR